MTYAQYCENMRKCGKVPLSREEFEVKKEDTLFKADMLKERGKLSQETSGSGFWGTLNKILGRMAVNLSEKMSNYLK